MTPEERIRAKVAGLKENQTQRQSEKLRNDYSNAVGVGNEAYEMNTPRIPDPNLRGRNRGRTVQPGYKYSDEVLQDAMDQANTDNAIMNEIFYQTLQRTGNPDLAVAAANTASYSPGVGTMIGLEDSYRAAADIPDAYREGDYMGMAKNAGLAGLGVVDAALTMLPFAGTLMKGARNLPKAMRGADDFASRGINAMDNFMAPRPPKANQNVLFDQVVKYLESRGQ